MILQEHNFAEEIVAAGLVHDVLEDTDMNKEQLVQELGQTVADIVDGVSEDTSLEWEERKALYATTVAKSSEGVRAVSIADKIHNAESIITDYESKGPAVWTVFNRGKEKKLWFEELVYAEVSKVWQHPLLDRYRTAIDILKTLD
jgi:(p)ppGpp synthase/HD superfamily hydrolase